MSDAPERVHRYHLEQRADAENRYSLFQRPHLFTIQSLERDLTALLAEVELSDLGEKTMLDVGCGDGAWLRRFVSYGTLPERQIGLDLMPEHVTQARLRSPGVSLVCGNAERLPFSAGGFDVVLQFVTLSSILDKQARRRAAREMLRVLKPGGVIISYDFIFNPLNRRTRGLPQREYRRLFPDCGLHFHRVTLAPPVTRRLVRLSWLLCALLEKVIFLRSHYLVVVQKQP